MRICILTLAKSKSRSGNRVTARRWSRIFRELGYTTSITDEPNGPFDLLIAIHAEKTSRAVQKYRERFPESRILVVVSGTDIYRNSCLSKRAIQNLNVADGIVTLESMALTRLPNSLQAKANTILQSATAPPRVPQPLKSCFEISVCGHLRKEKDPFLIVKAIQNLPESSRVHVNHVGGALTAGMAKKAREYSEQVGRYSWRGDVEHWKARRLMARSRLMINTSLMESAANSVIEAVVSGTPVLATRIPGNIGALGKDYPGLFSKKSFRQLSELLNRAESERKFYDLLKKRCRLIAKKFSPAAERLAWKKLLIQFRD